MISSEFPLLFHNHPTLEKQQISFKIATHLNEKRLMLINLKRSSYSNPPPFILSQDFLINLQNFINSTSSDDTSIPSKTLRALFISFSSQYAKVGKNHTYATFLPSKIQFLELSQNFLLLSLGSISNWSQYLLFIHPLLHDSPFLQRFDSISLIYPKIQSKT